LRLKDLFAGALEKMLEAEMEEHLGYEKNSFLGITAATAAMDMAGRPSRANGARVKLTYQGTGTAPLNQKLINSTYFTNFL